MRRVHEYIRSAVKLRQFFLICCPGKGDDLLSCLFFRLLRYSDQHQLIVFRQKFCQLKQAGFNLPERSLYRFSDHDYNIQENGVYVKRQYYNTHRSTVGKFAAASRRGWEWVAAHPDEALEIVMKYVRKNGIHTNRVMQKMMLEEVLRLQIDRESKRREFRVRADMVRKASKMMFEAGMLKREVTYKELIGL